jgi:hypothetical protein
VTYLLVFGFGLLSGLIAGLYAILYCLMRAVEGARAGIADAMAYQASQAKEEMEWEWMT